MSRTGRGDRTDPAAVRAADELPRLIAHRGFAEENPENTPTAFRAAARRADVVDMDVRRCGSGEPVVIHDATLGRVTDATGRVGETPLSELRDLDVLGSGDGVVTLREALAAVPPDTGVVAELKDPVVDEALPVFEAVENDVLISSFETDVLTRVIDRDGPPTARLALSGDGDALEWAIEAGCAAIHPERMTPFLAPEFIDRAHEAGLAVNVWTVLGREDAARLAAAGVDGITAETPVFGDSSAHPGPRRGAAEPEE